MFYETRTAATNNNNNNNNNNLFLIRRKLTSEYDQMRLTTITTCNNNTCNVNSITLSVQDEKGNLFDFNGMPIEFELEIN